MGGETSGRTDLQRQVSDTVLLRSPSNRPSPEDLLSMPMSNSRVWPTLHAMAATTASPIFLNIPAAPKGFVDHVGELLHFTGNSLHQKAEPSSSSTISSRSAPHFAEFPAPPLPFPHDSFAQQQQQLCVRAAECPFDYGDTSGLRERGSAQTLQQPCAGPNIANGGSLVLDVSRGELINRSKTTSQEITDAKALAALKNHSEAERRRRERINSHLVTLRTLLPSPTKTDKASLLGEVIDHLKDLKKQTAEIAEGGPVPSDTDELHVDSEVSSEEGDERVFIRATLCCDDRPDLYSDLTRVLHNLKLETVKAEIATLGGRIKNVLVMTRAEAGNDADTDLRPTVSTVHEALRAVMERTRSGEISPGGSSSKRQRLGASEEFSP